MNVYEMTDSDWNEFIARLDIPAVYKPKLSELLLESDPFFD